MFYDSYSLSSFDGKEVLIVVFVGNGCPTVKGYEDRLVASATGDLLAGREVRLPETQPFGCEIVW